MKLLLRVISKTVDKSILRSLTDIDCRIDIPSHFIPLRVYEKQSGLAFSANHLHILPSLIYSNIFSAKSCFPGEEQAGLKLQYRGVESLLPLMFPI